MTGEMVGPILINAVLTPAVIQAILMSNSTAQVIYNGAYTRIQAEQQCILSVATIEKIIGTAFRLPTDLEKIMCSFVGKLTMNEKEVRWECNR